MNTFALRMFDDLDADRISLTKIEFHSPPRSRSRRTFSMEIPKTLHHKFSQDLRKFGESCDRTAIMKQRLINDASSILCIPCSNSELESFINVLSRLVLGPPGS